MATTSRFQHQKIIKQNTYSACIALLETHLWSAIAYWQVNVLKPKHKPHMTQKC